MEIHQEIQFVYFDRLQFFISEKHLLMSTLPIKYLICDSKKNGP